MQAKTEFHPVGQGCFYSGKIVHEGKRQFNFVYDCGSNSDQEFIQDEIINHSVKKNGEILDLCVISHFHYDHVSGIPELLKNTECRRLVIPYYDKIERLIIYLLSEENNAEYQAMLEDPYKYFTGDQFNILEIVVIGGAAGNENPEIIGPIAPGPGQSDEGSQGQPVQFDAENLLEFSDSVQDEADNLSFLNHIKETEESVVAEKIKVAQMPYEMRVALWRFIFYCRTEEESYADGLDKQIETLTTYIDNYYKDQLKKPKTDVKGFKDLFNNKHIKEIKKIYVSIFGPNKLNGTSLTLYHEPLIKPMFYTPFWPPHHVFNGSTDRLRIGHLLTGDIDLEDDFKLSMFQNYFQFYLSRVAMFHVMHHGSDHNWPFIVSKSELDQFPAYVICHGLGRKHHPGKLVVAHLRGLNTKHILLNNELTRLKSGWYY